MVDFRKQMGKRGRGKDERPKVELNDLLVDGDEEAFIASAKEKGVYLELSADYFLPDERQPRKTFTPEGLDELRESIEQHGQIQPILVRPAIDGKYPIIAGERRWRAISASKSVSHVKAVISSGQQDELLLLLLQLDENNKREAVPVMETVAAMKRVVDLCKENGGKQGEAADMLGISPGRLSKYLSLVEVPEQIQSLSHGNKTQDLDTLYELGRASKKDPAAVAELLEQWESTDQSFNLRQAAASLSKGRKGGAEGKGTQGKSEQSKKPPGKAQEKLLAGMSLLADDAASYLVLVYADGSEGRIKVAPEALGEIAAVLSKDGE